MSKQKPVMRALKRWDGGVTEIRKAHEVRQLVACECGGLAWRDSALHVYTPGSSGPKYYHGRCHIKRFGIAAFLSLPREQTARMTLGDIGAATMRRLVEAR